MSGDFIFYLEAHLLHKRNHVEMTLTRKMAHVHLQNALRALGVND